MSTAPISLTLEQKVSARILEILGDMVEKEDLDVLIQKTIQENLFSPRVKKESGQYHSSPTITTELPSKMEELLVSLIDKQLKEKIDAAFTDWIEKNPDFLSNTLSEAIATNAEGYVQKILAGAVQSFFNSVDFKVQNFLMSNQKRQ